MNGCDRRGSCESKSMGRRVRKGCENNHQKRGADAIGECRRGERGCRRNRSFEKGAFCRRGSVQTVELLQEPFNETEQKRILEAELREIDEQKRLILERITTLEER